MKRLFPALLCICAAVPLLAAISALPPPVVVVYPLTATGPVAPDAGNRLALLFAEQIASGGGVVVKPAAPGVQRSAFLSSALSQGADYYVTGYLTPLGDEISLLIQVVSTYSGSVVWSTTSQVQTYADAAGQADAVRTAILSHAGRSLAALDQPPPVPSGSPPPASNGHNDANLSKIFQRRPRATPGPVSARPSPTPGTSAPTPGASATPRPTPKRRATPKPHATATAAATASPTPAVRATPAVGAIVVGIGGSADDADRSFASGTLGVMLGRAGLGGSLASGSSAGDLAVHASDLCRRYQTATIYSGTLDVRKTGGGIVRGTHADFELSRYDCATRLTTSQRVATDSASGAGAHDAINRAIQAALDAAHLPAKN